MHQRSDGRLLGRPSALDFRYTQGSAEQYIHFEKAGTYVKDVEWAFRLYNVTNLRKNSRLSFYLFNPKNPPGKGAGAYMEYGYSPNDCVPVKARQWLFLVDQGENWIDPVEKRHGAILYKQGGMAKRSTGDKYNNPTRWNVHPQHGPGVITHRWLRGQDRVLWGDRPPRLVEPPADVRRSDRHFHGRAGGVGDGMRARPFHH